MKPLFTNNTLAKVATPSLSSTATTIILETGTGDQFPAPVAGQYALLTLYEIATDGKEVSFEIVKLTNRVADNLTVERNFEPMAGAPHAYPTANNGGTAIYVGLRLTSHSANRFLFQDENLNDVPDKAQARENLGVKPGVDVQAYSAKLAALASLNWVADRIMYLTGAGTAALTSLTVYTRSLLTAADSATARATLGVSIGSDVQAYDANTAKTNLAQTFTKPQTADVLALTHNTSWDAADKQALTVEVNGSLFTVANPNNLRPNTYYALYVNYTTSHGLAFGSAYRGVSGLTASAAAGAHDHFIFRCNSAGNILELVAAAYNVGAA